MSKQFLPLDRYDQSNRQERYQKLVHECLLLVGCPEPDKAAAKFLDCFPQAADVRLMTSADFKRLKLTGMAGIERLLPLLSLGMMVARAPRSLLGHAYSSYQVGTELSRRYAGVECERVDLLLVDVHQEIIAFEPVFIGGFDECPVYTNRIFQLAIRYGAHGLILAHNHPTGDWQPSTTDQRFCQRLRRAATFLNLDLTDFIVVGNHGYYSWQEHHQLGGEDHFEPRLREPDSKKNLRI